MSNAPTPPRKRRRRWLLRLLTVFIVLCVGAELFARFKLGLGDPPLLMTDPDIEYLYQPSKTYNRFGNEVSFNQWSMRSDDFPAKKADSNELRILMLGDSVINGGAQTPQDAIASEIIKRELPARIGNRPVVVGNVSAGSWGPENLLAYSMKFGFFDSDIVIVVLSSHDWADVITFEPLGPDGPTAKPVLALQEAVTRYLPRYLPGGQYTTPQVVEDAAPDSPEVVKAVAALKGLLESASQSGAKIALALHMEANESMDAPKPGHAPMSQAARAAGADVIQLGPSFAQARQTGERPYRDEIHPNELGQRIIARTLMDWIMAQMREMDATRAAPPSVPATGSTNSG